MKREEHGPEIGVAFVGGGMVADLHHAAVAATPRLRLVGIHDGDPAVTQRRARDWGVTGYASLDEALTDDRVAAAYVLTPPDAHVPIALRCLERGRHVLVEKPVADDPAAVEVLQATAEATGVVAMPGHNYAYMPEFGRIVRLARSGDLGTLRAVWITYAIRHPEAVAAAYGGVLEEVMIHHAYLTLALLGAPHRLIAGTHDPAWMSHRAEDQAWMVWEYPSGASAFMFATFAADDNSADPWTFSIKVLGSEGSATHSWRNVISRNRKTSWFDLGFPLYEETYRHEATAFAEAIGGGPPLLSGLADAAAGARLLHAARLAATEHRVVERDDPDGMVRW